MIEPAAATVTKTPTTITKNHHHHTNNPQDVGNGIAGLARLIPQFALGNGLMNMSFLPILGFLDDTVYTPLDTKITGNSLVYMAVCGVVYFVLLLVLER